VEQCFEQKVVALVAAETAEGAPVEVPGAVDIAVTWLRSKAQSLL
jgi:hypothetical protein